MMPLDDTTLAEANSLSALLHALGPTNARLQADATAQRHEAVPKSYLDEALGVVIKNDTWERNVAEAAKTGAIFFGGRVGLASTVALYALDQIKVGDSFGGALMDAGLGVAKGTALRGLNTFAAAREFGIAGQAFTLGTGSRVLDSGLNRQTWTDSQTKAFSLEQGKATMLHTALDRSALVADFGAFALGGAMSGAINRFGENALRSSPFWRTTLTGGVFGLATGATSEVKREHDSGDKFDVSKILAAGTKQALFSAIAVAPAGMQAGKALRNTFVNDYGVKTIGEKGTYRYGFRINGEPQDLFTTQASRKGLTEAQSRLGEMAKQRQLDLAQTFGVSFAKPGEEITFRSDDGPVKLNARAPRINELTVMEGVLNKSQPGQLTLDGKSGAKFNFLQDKDAQALTASGLFEFHGETPNIFLHHEISQDRPLTERDRDPMPREDGRRRNSLEGVATHEIAHNSDMKVRGVDPELEESIRENLGWVRFSEGNFYEHDTHLLKGKDNTLYRFSSSDRTWVASDAQGNALDMQGNKAQPGAEFRLSNDEMMRQALVPPITDYFNVPTEMLMEGFKSFRVGGDSRAVLFRDSPILYEQVRAQDERELGLHYGVDATGQSLMVRLPDGTLATRDAQSLETIAQFEARRPTLREGFSTLQ